MKFSLVATVFYLKMYSLSSAVIPSHFPQPCSLSVANYSDCTLKYLKKLAPYLINGVKELNVPSFNPFHLPFYSVDTTIYNLLGLSAIITDLEIKDFDKASLQSFKYDPETMKGEVHFYCPVSHLTMKYNATGKVLTPIRVRSFGFLKANSTENYSVLQFSLRVIEKLGVKYYTVEDFKFKADVDSGYVELISSNSQDQGVANLITELFNQDAKRATYLFLPTFERSVERTGKFIVQRVLGVIPAVELMPR